MKVTRVDWDGDDAGAVAKQLQAQPPSLAEVSEQVAAIIAAVESEGDAALLRLERELGGVEPSSIRVGASQRAAARSEVDPAVVDALAAAAENIEAVAALDHGARTGLSNDRKSVTIAEVPVGSAGAYVPGGLGAYPSTALMCGVPARVAGVGRIAFASPAREDGRPDPLVLAAADLIGTSEVYAIGGAQAIAALALGTESVSRVDVIAGPGNRYVQEAKRQLVGRVGIDGIAGPSELMVIADGAVDLRLLALDLCAQAEHGDDGLLVACAPDESVLEEIERLVAELAGQRPSVKDPPLALVTAPSTGAAVELANALAPEHLQLACADADDLVDAVRTAGCVFVGRGGATAFGDYAAGSNHVLPTGGAGRFQGPLGPATFRRRLATVRITERGVAELAPVVATLAEAEGFPVHGESASARANEPEGNPPGKSPPGNNPPGNTI